MGSINLDDIDVYQSNFHQSHLNPLCDPFIPASTSVFTSQGADPVGDHSQRPGSGEILVNEMVRHMRISHDTQEKLTNLMVENQQRNILPQSSISKFSGDATEYQSFVRSFETRVASRTKDDSERLHYLEQYTSGAPKEIVRSCMRLSADQGYLEARKRLEQWYGGKFRVSQAYLQKLEKWPVVRGDDPRALDELTTFLVGCHNTLQDESGVSELDYPTSLRTIVNKLPVYLKDRWARIVDNIMYIHGDRITFKSLVDFLERESRVALNPLFGCATREVPHEKSKFQGKASGKGVTAAYVSLARDQAPKKDTPQLPRTDGYSKPCLLCDNNHPLSECRKFARQLLKERMAFLQRKRLCYSCLRAGHFKPDCPKRETCHKCSGDHPTALHRSAPLNHMNESSPGNTPQVSSTSQETPAPATLSSAIGVGNSLLSIIPVRVKMKTGHREVCTHAFLDNGSSDCFMTEELFYELGGIGRRTTINLTTLNKRNEPTKVFCLDGLQVRGIDEVQFLDLPHIYTQPTLPVGQEHIPQQKDLKAWPNLSGINMPELDAGISLLIGNSAPKALEPWDMINSQDNSPYAVKTALGWTVCGPRSADQDDDLGELSQISIHRIQVDNSFEDQLRTYMEYDFNEDRIFGDERALSVQDKAFLEQVNSSTVLTDGHYCIGLPKKPSILTLQNNRCQALQRLHSLQRKFSRNEDFKGKYVSFVEDLFVKGYASEVLEENLSQTDRPTWYLPHHGVFHPRKQKIRVVFDCSARFAGASLNSHLLQGPDLTNNLVGVLLRFRQDKFAVMANLESMFHQVRVPTEDQDLLRFLWWPKGDTTTKPKEYCMHVHIFGATSSPAVCVYALNRTAQDNVEDFGKETVDTVKQSFYMDDCLKSFPTEDEACNTARELVNLCQRGGWRLTKWVSNSRKVLSTVPETELAPAVQDMDLDRDGLPRERALGIQWSPETDTLGYNTVVPEKPATKRGILSAVSSVFDPLGLVAPFILKGKFILQEL